MKKIGFTILCLFVLSISMFAQNTEFKSKNGATILPKSGDFALGVNAVPVFNYLGNMFNESSMNSLNIDFISDQAIVGKYFLSDKSALRVGLRLGFNSDNNKEFIMKDLSTPDPEELVTDKMMTNMSNFHINVAYELRRGERRLQGYYGGAVALNYSRTNIKYKYGNEMNADFTSPLTTDFGGNVIGGTRVLSTSNLSNFGFGLRGFIGAEYFFAPKISIGCEFGWGPYFNIVSGGSDEVEFWNGEEVEVETTDLAKDSNFGFDTDNAYGNIFLLFHF